MPIKIVVNGYFRSGTTFIWKYLKESLRDYACFYEPLNPELALYIKKEKHTKRKDRMHNEYLMQEYLSLDEGTLNRLLLNHPSTNKSGIYNEEALKAYLDIFHNLPCNVLLQPNRLHFFLDLFFNEYKAKVIHIIRHPLDVYLSMQKAYSYNYNSSITKSILKKMLKVFAIQNKYDVDKDYKWIAKHTGYPYASLESWNIKYLNRFDYFSKFVVVWVVSNYYAIKTIEKNGGLLVAYEEAYEELLQNPEEVLFKQLSVYLNTDLKSASAIKNNNYFKFSGRDFKKFQNIISQYKLEKEFEYIER